MTATDIARALHGIRSGAGWLCRCPVPSHGKGHGDRRPSLLISDGERALLVHCFAGCDSGAVLDELRRLGLLDEGPADRTFAPPPLRLVTDQAPDPLAMALWRRARPIAGSLAERYLIQHRRLDGRRISSRLRFLDQVRYGGLSGPAMVALVEDDTGPIAAQLTFLDPAGRKRDRRTVGGLADGAVRLETPQDGELGLAEGTESAIAATMLTGVPCWSVLGARRMHHVQIPAGVTELHAFVDDDPTGATAAEKTVAAHRDIRVVVHLPLVPFNDVADQVQAEAEERIA